MQVADVVGRATATVKHESLEGSKMLIVQPRMLDGSPDGHPLIAVDGVGAGVGQSVMISSDGKFGRQLLNHPSNPVRWTIVGIRDEPDSTA